MQSPPKMPAEDAFEQYAFLTCIDNDKAVAMYDPPLRELCGMHMHVPVFATRFCSFCHSKDHVKTVGSDVTCPTLRVLLAFKIQKELGCRVASSPLKA